MSNLNVVPVSNANFGVNVDLHKNAAMKRIPSACKANSPFAGYDTLRQSGLLPSIAIDTRSTKHSIIAISHEVFWNPHRSSSHYCACHTLKATQVLHAARSSPLNSRAWAQASVASPAV